MYRMFGQFAIISILFLIPLSLFSATINVPTEQPTIQAGIDAAVDGDTVLVAPGVYTENIDFNSKAVIVLSTGGARSTTIQPTDKYLPTIIIRNAVGITGLIGFSIINGGTNRSEGNLNILSNTDTTYICENIFHSNSVGSHNNNPIIRTYSISYISRNLFYNNGGINCIWSKTPTDIINNTFDNNARGILCFDGESIAINNIITNSNQYAVYGTYGTLAYNDVWNNGSKNNPGFNGISEDPLFIDETVYNYSLQFSSPCIDAGDPNPLYNDEDGTRNDMGAFQDAYSVLYPYNLNFGSSENEHAVYSLIPTIYWTYFDPEPTTQNQYQIQVGIDQDWTVAEMWDSGPVLSSDENAIYEGQQLSFGTSYYLRLRVNNGSYWSGWNYSWFDPEKTFQVGDIHYGPTSINNEITTLVPEIFWTYFDSEGTSQTEYQIQVGTDQDWTVAEMWDTGPVSSTISSVLYNGSELLYNVMYFIRIRAYSGSEWTDWKSSWFHNPRIFEVMNINYGPTANGHEITTLIPEIFWTYYDSEGFTQEQYQIQIGTDGDWSVAEMWDSGPVSSPNSSVIYTGLELSYNNIYFLRIRAYGGGEWTDWEMSWFLNPRTIEVRDINYGPTANGNEISTLQPEIFWTYYDSEGFSQAQYQIQVGTDDDWTVAEMWDTGPVESSETKAVYDGVDVLYNTNYFLRIRAGDGVNWTVWESSWFYYPRIFEVRDINYGEYTNIVTTLTPEINWTYYDSEPTTQTQYQIQVGIDDDWTTVEMWDSDPVASSESFSTYDGLPLNDKTYYYVRIRINDGLDWSDWAPSWFVTHFLQVIYVPADFPTIQEGIDYAMDDDTILVAPGRYLENISNLRKSISILSEEGPDNTVIEPANISFSNVNIYSGGHTVIKGFTFKNSERFGAIVVYGSAEISYNYFEENRNAITVINNNSDPKIHHNLFIHNGDEWAIVLNSGAQVYNNTFESNERGVYLVDLISGFSITNNIFCNGLWHIYSVTPIPQYAIDYNDFWNNWDNTTTYGDNDISADPQFVDIDNHNYNLRESSPCIDAGYPGDLDSDGTIIDMGAFPRLFVLPYPKKFNYGESSHDNHVISLTPDFFWTYFDVNPTNQVQYQIQVGTDDDWNVVELWDSGPVNSTLSESIYDGLPLNDFTKYYLRIRLNNGTSWGEWANKWFITKTELRTFKVPGEIPTIQKAIDTSLYGDTVLVAAGIYFANMNFLGKTIVVISEKGPTKTFVRPSDVNEPTVRINQGEGFGTVLSGFSIRNGEDLTSTVIIGNNSEPIIENNIFRDNISERINPLAVIKVKSHAIIRYNLFFDNGGICAIWSAGNAEIINNTIDSNEQGVYSSNSETVMRNNIITNNLGYGAFGYFGVNDYNNVWNNGSFNDPGPNGISSDPLFIDISRHDYNMRLASPCIDAGDPDPVFNDLNGTRNDMGAIPFYYCGDVDLNNVVSVSDIVYLINYYFAGGPLPTIFYKADVNCDDLISLVDIILMNHHILSNGSIKCCYW